MIKNAAPKSAVYRILYQQGISTGTLKTDLISLYKTIRLINDIDLKKMLR